MTYPDDQASLPAQVTDEPAGYAQASAELESILAEVEHDSVDVDVLASKVARAAFLVRWCRDRIDGTRADVEQIVGDLDRASAEVGES